MSAMYAIYHGPKGLKDIAQRVHDATLLLAEGNKEFSRCYALISASRGLWVGFISLLEKWVTQPFYYHSHHTAPKFLLLVIGYRKGHVWVTSKIQTCAFKLKLVI